MENEAHNLTAVERILSTTLPGLPNLRLWSAYLDHIRRLNDITRDTTGNTRQTITQAYEVALDNIGMDKDSGYLWQEYIQFLKSKPGETGGPTWQGQQKMDQLRDAYRKAIKVPTQATQSLWKEYDQFEMSMNKNTVSFFRGKFLGVTLTVAGAQISSGGVSCVHDRPKLLHRNFQHHSQPSSNHSSKPTPCPGL